MKTLIFFKYRGKSKVAGVVRKPDFGLALKLASDGTYVIVQKNCKILGKSW